MLHLRTKATLNSYGLTCHPNRSVRSAREKIEEVDRRKPVTWKEIFNSPSLLSRSTGRRQRERPQRRWPPRRRRGQLPSPKCMKRQPLGRRQGENHHTIPAAMLISASNLESFCFSSARLCPASTDCSLMPVWWCPDQAEAWA